MADNRFHKLTEDVRRMADEVRLQIHLGSMEARDLWSRLEPKLAQFEADSARIANEVGDDVTRGVGQLGEELERGLDKLRGWLRVGKPAAAGAGEKGEKPAEKAEKPADEVAARPAPT